MSFFFQALFISFSILHSSSYIASATNTPAKPAVSVHTPTAGLLIGKEAPIKNEKQPGLASLLLKSVLIDQLKTTPELSKPYIFFMSEPGTFVQNICNRGGHVALVFAAWRAPPPAGTQWQTFQADIHELGVGAWDRYWGTRPAKHEDDNFEDPKAGETIKDKYYWVAMGKSGLNLDFKHLTEFIDKASDDYFKTGENHNYDYYKRNCGHYVEAMIEKLQVEHPLMSDVVYSPLKRGLVFLA